ncbi:MAG: DUF3298 and DUF4163 domain-containing protein [Lewinellaceae bacterium]|nr:DUF3298 and DUF4163 domain-containing protein [Lewinellaceae bacterium]
MRYSLLGFSCLFLLLISCRKKDVVNPGATPSPLKIGSYSFQRGSEGCQGDSTYCATFEVSYPLIEGGNPAAVKAINDTILHYVKTALISGEADMPVDEVSLEALADTFLQNYQTFGQEFEFAGAWTLSTTGKVLYSSGEVLSVELDNYSYTGGAHPNSYSSLLNFDPKTGKLFQLTDFITDMEKFKQLAEKSFRAVRELDPNATLNEQGFFWDGDFQLPANFAIQQNGIYLYYNTYEVGPYVVGPTEFVLSNADLTAIRKK